MPQLMDQQNVPEPDREELAVIYYQNGNAAPPNLPPSDDSFFSPPAQNRSDDVVIIQGNGKWKTHRTFLTFRRKFSGYLTAVLVVVVLVGFLSQFSPISPSISNQTSIFRALLAAVAYSPPQYIVYTVVSGDTIESIAKKFGVSPNGIYKINNFYAGEEVTTGQKIKISSNPAYGADYVAPAQQFSGSVQGIILTNNFETTSCMFCAVAGWTNGPGRPCAPAGTQNPVDITQFAFSPPEKNAQFVRGFTWYHNGVDITTGFNDDPIYAAQTGVVIFAGWDPYGGGLSVKISHCGGVATSYSHLSAILVHMNDSITQGQVVGLQGMTGNATGPHLHFMVWFDNIPIDPLCAYASLGGYSSQSHYGGCPAPKGQP